MTQRSREAPAKLEWLQVLRALAALSVVLFHVSYLLAVTHHVQVMAAVFGWRFGRFGVVMFFAISGALMAHLAPRTSGVRFLSHRLVRIYPTYVMAALAATAVAAGDSAAGGAGPDWRGLALIPGGHWNYLLGVEWTLPFELAFYLIVTLFIWLGQAKRLPLVALFWLLAIYLGGRLDPTLPTQWQFPSLLCLPWTEFSTGFACGLLVPWVLRWRLAASLSPALGLLFLLASEVWPHWTIWMLALGCTGLTAGAMARPRSLGMLARPFVLLGDWSFALYLCHVQIAEALLRAPWLAESPLRAWGGAIFACLVGGILFGAFDVALHRRLRRWIDAVSPTVRLALVLIFVGTFVGGGLIVEFGP